MRLARPCQRCGVPFRLHTLADTRRLCGPCLVKARKEWRLEQGQRDSEDRSDFGCYVPTPEEIAAACREIRLAKGDWAE